MELTAKRQEYEQKSEEGGLIVRFEKCGKWKCKKPGIFEMPSFCLWLVSNLYW